jgi:hypothetical protein
LVCTIHGCGIPSLEVGLLRHLAEHPPTIVSPSTRLRPGPTPTSTPPSFKPRTVCHSLFSYDSTYMSPEPLLCPCFCHNSLTCAPPWPLSRHQSFAFPSSALCRLSAHRLTPNLTPRKRTSSRSIFQQCRIHTPRRHPNITNDRSSYKAVVHRKLGEINICFHGPHELDVDTPQTVSLWRSSRSTHHVGMSFWVFDRNTV